MKKTAGEQQKKIAGFAAGYSVREAAAAYQVSPASVYRWLRIYHPAKSQSALTVVTPPAAAAAELTIRINFLTEYANSNGSYSQIYQLTAIDRAAGRQYLAFSLERSNTVAEIFREYLKYCYQQTGLPPPKIRCSCYRNEFTGYATPETLPKKRKPDALLSAYLCQHPALNDCHQLLIPAYAAQLLNPLPPAQNAINYFPVVIRCAFLRQLAVFDRQEEAWAELVSQDYRLELLEKALTWLTELAFQSYRQSDGSRALELFNTIIVQPECRFRYPALTVRVLLGRAKIYSQRREFEQALADLHLASEILPAQPEPYYQLSLVFQDLSNPAKSEEYLVRAAELYQHKKSTKARCRYFECRGKLFYYFRQDYPNALRNFNKMKKYAALLGDNQLLYEAVGFLAGIYYLNRNYELAATAYQENEIIAGLNGDENQLSTVFYALALTCRQLQQLEQAQIYFRRCLTLAERQQNQEKIISARIGLGDLYFTTGDLSSARREFVLARKLHARLQITDRTTVAILNHLGILCRSQKKYREAITHFQECIRLNKLLKDDQFMVNFHAQIADIYRLTGEDSKAVSYYLQARRLAGGSTHFLTLTASIFYHLAVIHLKHERYTLAASFLKSAKKQFQSLFLQNQLPRYRQRLTEISELQQQLPVF